MKDGQEFYEITALVSKESLDKILKKRRNNHTSSPVFDILNNGGLDTFEVKVAGASAYIQQRCITIGVSGNGNISSKKGFDRYKED